MRCRLLLGTVLAAAAALRPPTPALGRAAHADVACSSRTRRLLLPAALAAALLPPMDANAAEDAAAGDCLSDCVRECNIVAPGNVGYCETQCDTYCKDVGPTGTGDVLRTDVTESYSDCTRYKTDAARAYCEKKGKKAVAAAPSAPSSLQMNNGIFGDSGVVYSKGVEDLLASAFGATRQAKPLNEANVDAFAGEVFDKAKAAILGGE